MKVTALSRQDGRVDGTWWGINERVLLMSYILTAVAFVGPVATLIFAVTHELCWNTATWLASEVFRWAGSVSWASTHNTLRVHINILTGVYPWMQPMSTFTFQQDNKNVGKPYNAADARRIDFPKFRGRAAPMVDFFGGRRWWCQTGRE